MPDKAERKGPLCFVAGQSAGRVEHCAQLVPLGQFALLGGDAAGDLFQLSPVGQLVLYDHYQFLQFDRHLQYGRENDDERPVGLAGADLLGQDVVGVLENAVDELLRGREKPTADVVVLGWRLGLIADYLRGNTLTAVCILPKRYAELERNAIYVSSITIKPVDKK